MSGIPDVVLWPYQKKKKQNLLPEIVYIFSINISSTFVQIFIKRLHQIQSGLWLALGTPRLIIQRQSPSVFPHLVKGGPSGKVDGQWTVNGGTHVSA